MLKQIKAVRLGYRTALVGLAAALFAPASALGYTGEFARFAYCPVSAKGASTCLYSETTGGEIVLGSKKTPIVNKVILQGAFSEENEETTFSSFYGATNGETLTKVAQPVPGGLLGIVPPENSPALVKLLSKYFFENSLTGVNATLELAKPASEIEISKYNLLLGSGTSLKLPVKVHLENPFLGKSCYVGSSSSPIIWNLTTGTTSPPEPNKPITGKQGFPEVLENYELAKIKENALVENAWSAPAATGCGGILSFLVDPVIDSMIELPAKAGHNTAILDNTIYEAATEAVTDH